MKTNELTGPALDWVVSYCLVFKAQQDCQYIDLGVVEAYSTDWAQGGPIIERERICLDIGHDGVWLAYSKQNYDDDKEFMHSGPTPLIAAMRCYCASKLGDEVEVPDELA